MTRGLASLACVCPLDIRWSSPGHHTPRPCDSPCWRLDTPCHPVTVKNCYKQSVTNGLQKPSLLLRSSAELFIYLSSFAEGLEYRDLGTGTHVVCRFKGRRRGASMRLGDHKTQSAKLGCLWSLNGLCRKATTSITTPEVLPNTTTILFM